MALLSIILAGLKIIGLILLGLLIFILFLLLVVLFVPLWYKISAGYEEEKFSGEAEIGFLFKLLRAKIRYEEELFYALKLGFFTLFSSDKTAKPVKARKAAKEQALTEPEENKEKMETTFTEPDLKPPVTDKEEVEAEKEPAIKKADKKEKRAKKSIFAKIKEKYQGIREKFRASLEKLNKLNMKREAVINFLNADGTLEGLKFLLSQALRLIKSIFPRRLEGRLRFGTGDVYTEGQYLTYLCLIYPLTAGKLVIEPEWEEEVIEGHIKTSGKIRLFVVLIIALKVLLAKKTKRLKGNFNRCKRALGQI